jgi:tRNA dimethylallyltransferase
MAMAPQKYLVVVAGPTAIGKTDVAIQLAEQFFAEIFSADSRQFFDELNIGVAKPTNQQLQKITHHFIGHISIDNIYTVGDFENEAMHSLEHYFEKNDLAFMVGGAGLYIDAVCHGIDEMPAISTSTKATVEALFNEKGIDYLVEIIQKHDPYYYEEVDKSNARRVVRAVEVILQTQLPFSFFRKKKSKVRPFKIIKIGLTLPREQLYDRINQRVDAMIANGLVEEVKALKNKLPNKNLDTIGYREVFDYLDGEISLETAVELIKQHTRQYAKRQLTWFRKDESIQWFEPSSVDACITYIKQQINQS